MIGSHESPAEEAAPDLAPADEVFSNAAAAVDRAREVLARVDADLKAAVPVAVLGTLRGLAASCESAMEDPDVADRVRRGAYHLAGVLDALGVLPAAVAIAVADAFADYAAGPVEG